MLKMLARLRYALVGMLLGIVIVYIVYFIITIFFPDIRAKLDFGMSTEFDMLGLFISMLNLTIAAYILVKAELSN